MKDLGERNCGRNSHQQESLQVQRIVESSSTADNGSHHCLDWRALGLFDSAGFAFVATPTLPGMEMLTLSVDVLRCRFYQLNEGEGCSTFVWTVEEMLLLMWAMAATVCRSCWTDGRET